MDRGSDDFIGNVAIKLIDNDHCKLKCFFHKTTEGENAPLFIEFTRKNKLTETLRTSNITLKVFLNQISKDKLVTLKGLIISGG